MKITNLTNGILSLLKKELASKKDVVTVPLVVSSIGNDHVVVSSSKDTDLLIKLNGITDVTVGSKVTVNIDTYEVTLVEGEAPKATSTKAAPGTRGSSNRSHIAR